MTSAGPGLNLLAGGLNMPDTDYNSLPTASSCPGYMVYCSNAPGGAALVLSDGTTWRTFARGLQSFIATTDASGNATWAFSPAFAAAPVMGFMVENTGSQPYSCEITAISATSVTIKVRQAQTLPAVLTLLTQLIGFNIFGGTTISGIRVHLRASPATQ